MSPNLFAKKVLKSVAKNKAIVILPSWWKVYWWINRLFPSLGMSLAQKRFQKKQKELGIMQKNEISFVQQSFKKQRGAMKRKIIALGFLLLSCSCTTTYRIERYDLKKKYVTGVGFPMVVREKCWGDSYHQATTSKNCILRQELLYAGREGHVIHMTYKEYVGQNGNYSSVESFLQYVGYDLRQSDIISFRDIYIKVIEASKTSIEFMVIDPLTYRPYPLY